MSGVRWGGLTEVTRRPTGRIAVLLSCTGSKPPGRSTLCHQEDPNPQWEQDDGPDHKRSGTAVSNEPRECGQVSSRTDCLLPDPIQHRYFCHNTQGRTEDNVCK